MKIKITKLDAMYSKKLRERKPICEVCKKRKSTQVHHYFGRRKRSTRYWDDNMVVCCYACHRIMHENPETGRTFMKERLGDEGYEQLVRRSNTIIKEPLDVIEESIKNMR